MIGTAVSFQSVNSAAIFAVPTLVILLRFPD
jgi:hypothetical protein